MNSFKCRVILIGLLLMLAIAVPVLAQTVQADDGTTLKQIIVFGRHSIRSSTNDPTTLDQFSADPFHPFVGVPTGYLTPNGGKAESLLGAYFNAYLVHEGLLTGSAADGSISLVFPRQFHRALLRHCHQVWGGLIPDATIPVHSYAIADPDRHACCPTRCSIPSRQRCGDG